MATFKKLLLTDEEGREYKRLQRPADASTKAKRSLQLSRTLRDNTSTPDDQRVIQYVSALRRYLNTRGDLPDEPKVEVNPLTPLPPAPGRGRKKKKKKTATTRRWEQY